MRRDFSPPPKKTRKPLFIGAGIIVIAIVWSTQAIFRNDMSNESITTIVQKATQPPFPDIQTKALSSTQRSILTIVQQEYDKIPRDFDSTVMKYTENTKESWCADFISWTFSKAGAPFTNPNSGYWRIPGVLTLQQYYRDNSAYIKASNSDTNTYTPQLGDVAFYIGAQTPDNTSEEHAAIILKVDGDVITTIGGNEGSGIMHIRSESLQAHFDKGLVGFGQLKNRP